MNSYLYKWFEVKDAANIAQYVIKIKLNDNKKAKWSETKTQFFNFYITWFMISDNK